MVNAQEFGVRIGAKDIVCIWIISNVSLPLSSAICCKK